jgi:hypothetical protein
MSDFPVLLVSPLALFIDCLVSFVGYLALICNARSLLDLYGGNKLVEYKNEGNLE